jgi:non-ribosomal peptide synthetase component E (peptide arylation enzyme)
MQVVSLSGNVPLSSVYTTTNTNTFKVQNSAAGMTMSIRLSAGGDPAEYAVLKYPDGFKFVSHPFDIMKGGTVAVLTLGSYKEDEVVAAIAMEG